MGFDMFESFIIQLKERLHQPLPGPETQLKMAPLHRDEITRYIKNTAPAKKGSVLILLYPSEGEIYVPLMLRPDYGGAHSGQVSFPGGKKEEADEDLIATALRESREEIGVQENNVTVLGTLTELFIHASNFTVLPVVGYIKEKPFFLPNPYEVSMIIESSLSNLLDVKMLKYKKIKLFNQMEVDAPYYDVLGHVVWGATAMIISEFLEIVRNLKIYQ